MLWIGLAVPPMMMLFLLGMNVLEQRVFPALQHDTEPITGSLIPEPHDTAAAPVAYAGPALVLGVAPEILPAVSGQ